MPDVRLRVSVRPEGPTQWLLQCTFNGGEVLPYQPFKDSLIGEVDPLFVGVGPASVVTVVRPAVGGSVVRVHSSTQGGPWRLIGEEVGGPNQDVRIEGNYVPEASDDDPLDPWGVA
ncbi:MAG: hypothetical protein AAGA48_11450 [Myxococcota bacterium]